jgi:hypothetical protein
MGRDVRIAFEASLQEEAEVPGAGKYERWLQHSRAALIGAGLVAAAVFYAIKYFAGA